VHIATRVFDVMVHLRRVRIGDFALLFIGAAIVAAAVAIGVAAS